MHCYNPAAHVRHSKHLYIMKVRYLIFLATVTLIALIFACTKESPTIVNGTVVDKYTKKPLEGVSIDINIWREEERGYSYYKTINTDSQGKFSFGSDATPDFRVQRMDFTGYLSKQNTIYDFFENYEDGKINEGVIPMIPLDAVLSLRLENLSGTHDSIFVEIFSPLLKSEIGISGGKVFIPNPISSLTPGQSLTQNIPLASDQEITIYWDYKPISHFTAIKGAAPIVKNDTVFYTISY